MKSGVTLIIQQFPARCLFTIYLFYALARSKDKWTCCVLLACYLTQTFNAYMEISDEYGRENGEAVGA